ncbi:MAG: amidohydrolase family protein [Acidimicrobiia bacterium]
MRFAFRSGPDERELGVANGAWAEERDGPSVDLRRFWALPGLADCHAHLAADSLVTVDVGGEIDAIKRRVFAQLERGVFLIIDKGWRDDVVLRLLDEPPADRPHLEAAARIITGVHGYFPGFAVEVDDDELPQAVAEANTRGGWVKLVGDWPQKGRGPVINFGEDALVRACEVAHAAGARVAIHTMAPDTPSMAVRAGVDSIEHGLYLTPEDLTMLGERGGAWVPTIANTEDILAAFATGSTAARVLGQGLENLRESLPQAAEIGVSVLAGTDLGLRHGEVAAEVLRLHSRGLPPEAAIDASGPAAYRYLGLSPFSPGSSADLLLFETDPTTDLTALGSPIAGMRAGRIVFDHAAVILP